MQPFLKLCEDSVWSVRKSAVESLAMINLMCSEKCRWEKLTPVILNLLKDPHKWVSLAAFKILGQFISAFAKPCITGLAYTRTGELYITNAADEDFK